MLSCVCVSWQEASYVIFHMLTDLLFSDTIWVWEAFYRCGEPRWLLQGEVDIFSLENPELVDR